MIDKVIVLPNKENRLDSMEKVQESGARIKLTLGSFILIEEPTFTQVEELEANGLEVQTIDEGIGDLTQFDEEDQLLMGAYLLRRSSNYQSPNSAEIPEEEELMSQIDCGGEEH